MECVKSYSTHTHSHARLVSGAQKDSVDRGRLIKLIFTRCIPEKLFHSRLCLKLFSIRNPLDPILLYRDLQSPGIVVFFRYPPNNCNNNEKSFFFIYFAFISFHFIEASVYFVILANSNTYTRAWPCFRHTFSAFITMLRVYERLKAESVKTIPLFSQTKKRREERNFYLLNAIEAELRFDITLQNGQKQKHRMSI